MAQPGSADAHKNICGLQRRCCDRFNRKRCFRSMENSRTVSKRHLRNRLAGISMTQCRQGTFNIG
jgi:hypothetical protein